MKAVFKIIIILLVLSIFVTVFFMVKPKVQELNVEDYKTLTTDELLDFIDENMVSGGPPKDGIPALDQPRYIGPAQVDFLEDDDLIFGVDYKSQVKAYPRKIMYWHEIVNEEFVGELVSITYCPLTGSVIGYKGYNLGVSGNLYNSNLVMYDRKTDTEIPQILGIGVNGPAKGQKLKQIPVIVTTWKKWLDAYPQTEVLSPETGFGRDYDRNPYPGYDETLRVWFPIVATSSQFHSKKIVTTFMYNDMAFAIPKDEFSDAQKKKVTANGVDFLLSYDDNLDVLRVYDTKGELMISVDMFWFAWYAYHPDTIVIESDN